MFRRYVGYAMPRLACDRPLSYIYLRHLTQKVIGVMHYGISLWVREELIRQLQSVMNAAARLIYGLCHSDHISNALITLHWLRAQERVRFKTAVLVYKATHTAPAYLSHA